jgi:type I restriction-modification system DNA methylase subunit
MARIRRSADQHPELGLPEVRKLWQTEGLFSDHYLKKRIRQNSWWPTDAEAQPVWEFSKALYEKRYIACAKNNEAFTRQELLDKILEKLGFAWTDNLGQPETRQDLEPDYILFANDAEKEAVINQDAAHRYRAAIAILEAKKVNHPLSQLSKSQQRYPHQQIRDYLNEAQVLTWGVLTNGNEWRLYCRDTKPSHFFAINFELAIQSLDAFKFFVALFSPTAFVRDAQGKCRLDHVRENALAAQSELEEDLRQRIFAIVEILANGFAERAENEITDADLPRVYDACLIFLYRLLFILYAEGRQLLPVEPKSRKYYKELSLARLVTPLKNFSEHDSRTRTHLYGVILELCNLINGTDEKKNTEYSVPRYNGGLFAPERHPLLEKWRISDGVIADVLRGLMFNPQPERDEPALPIETVDFGDLRVQQLGSIYEGLLEHHFAREGVRLVLKTDKAERKATGTYYTPDYIVKYLVEETVGPLVAEIDEREPVKKARAAELKDNSFAREALALNILDPAMGSGHFLVEATTFLADEIAAHPTTQPLSDKSKDEDEIAHWRRRVVESCIYGVDLNPLAVELAKLSLWLTTIATDQPLNFLDHHFCCGNSLVGARLEEMREVPELKKKKDEGLKLAWKGTENLRAALQKAVRFVEEIEERESANVDAVKSKEKLWSEKVRPALEPFRAVANLWISCFFGNELPQLEYEALIELLDVQSGKTPSWKSPAEFQAITAQALKKSALKLAGRTFDEAELAALCARLKQAAALGDSRKFFHWELEFPEVFFNDDGSPRESPGFDAVIGNPPWEKISASSRVKGFLDWAFQEIREGEINFYNLFIYHAHELAARGRNIGQLIPNTWLINKYSALLRRFVLTNFHTQELFYMCKGVFQDAPDTIPVMLLAAAIHKQSPPKERDHTRVKVVKDELLNKDHFLTDLAWNDQGQEAVWFERPLHQMSVYDTEKNLAFCRRLETRSLALGELVHASDGIYKSSVEGVRTVNRQAPSDRPVIESADQVNRYIVDWTGSYIPQILWQQHAELHDGEKLILHAARKPKLERRLVAGFSTEEVYFSNRFILLKMLTKSYSALFLLSLINSSLLNRYFKIRFPITDVDGYMLHQLPIRRIDFTTPAAKRAAQIDKAKLHFEKSPAGDTADALGFVETELQAGRADVVHDLLTFLAERMIVMNAEKRRTAKQFQIDLKDFHGIDAHALNPKTKLDEFWKLEAADVFAHLRKNTKVLTAQNVRLTEAAEETIRARFSQSKSALLPLDAQIAFTDGFIDEIVYRLYGLTQDERQIVEAN